MLAAGLSRRMGGPNKLLQRYRGKPLLAHALRAAGEMDFVDRIAVTGRDRAEVETVTASYGFRCVHNDRFQDGLGTSLAAGARALHPGANGVFIALGDMPEIEIKVYRALAGNFGQRSIVVPVHDGLRGHPVLFCASYLAELSALSSGEGARSLLRRHKPFVVEVATNDPAVLRDIDTREDFDISGSKLEVPV